ncbi:MAG TPA: 16S rRNA (cytidine(1402)-2'-O)-methyltransferase, partial [Rhodospirillaceae bacterium]|nr:16S rRNA (cytidine(1402)-2'-O)-methyltransferase [Rhodospirillaceae bacterium]
NEQDVAKSLIEKIQSGASVALVSDAGTPLLSDPGYRIMQAALAAKINVTALPGANALLPALQLSGLPAYPFYFGGFLPTRSKSRKDLLMTLKELSATLVFYEAPHRIKEMLADAVSVLGPTRCGAVVREISKKFEEARRDTLFALHNHYSHNDARGEIVVVIEAAQGGQKWNEETVVGSLAKALKSGVPFREAVMIVSAQSQWPRRDVYDLALKQRSDSADNPLKQKSHAED